MPGIRIKVPNRHSTYGRVKVKTIPLGFAASLAKNFSRVVHSTCVKRNGTTGRERFEKGQNSLNL